jgi:signal transduction histidine kinase/DNA-binding response OmpR family regulator
MQTKPSILIVDDDPGSNRTLALIFGRKGYETDTATTGQEALDKAREKTFNLALLDIKLPDITGVALIPSLKQLCPDMAVIIVTGYASVDTAVQALDYGATAYLTKPLDMDAVLVTVKETLDKQLLVVEKKQAEIAMHRYIERLRTVRAIDGAILAGGTPAHITQVCLRFLKAVVPYHVGGVIVYDLDKQEATLLVLETDEKTEVEVEVEVGASFPLEDLFDIDAAQPGTVHVVADVLDADLPPLLVEGTRELGIRSYLGAPLIAQGQLIGSFVLGIKESDGFSPEHVDIAREVADQLAIGIQQAHLREQVQQHTIELEQQVATRTADLTRRQVQLQVAAEVARDASRGSDLQGLMTRAVNLIRERFGFYHAGIFLTDEPGEYAILRAATGEGGQQMLATGHRLPVGKTGLVGYVTGSGQPRIANDADADTMHFDNPLLPKTRSEMALPLHTGEQIIGALDVQSTKENAFDDDDIGILQVLADQLAVAIERTRLFEQIQATLEARLQMIISNLPIILVTMDREGVYTLAEGKGFVTLGLEPGRILGRSIEEVFPGHVDLLDHAHRALAGETFTTKVTLGERVFESWYGPLRNEAGKVIGVTTVRIDVTERQSLEVQIHRQERLAAVGQLAGGIAHDFNNFLTTIIMYAGLIQRVKRLPGEVVPLTKVIMDESRRASQLVRQVLDFSRRSMMEVEPVDLQSFVQETVDILRKTLAENIELSLKSPPGEYIVNADPTRIQQVLMNLALNARDAMPDGGKLQVSLSRVHAVHADGLSEKKLEDVSAAPEVTSGEWVRLSVADTGTGMTEMVRTHLFEPFFTTKGLKGNGLGLAQVYGIIKQHGGEIDVETELGRGTTFHIDLPVYQRKSEPEAEAPTAALFVPEGHGETILLVEDKENVRGANLYALESLGYRVLAAANGLAALSLYEAATEGKGIDLVITDLLMPGMGGRELIQRLRAINPEVKVVAVTGHVMREELAALREADLVEVMYKPLDINTLASVVNRMLNPNPVPDETF